MEMTNITIPWDSITASINRRLPGWARYKGYGTYALVAYIYVGIFTVGGALAYTNGVETGEFALWVLAFVGVLLGNYYRTAAQLRVECAHCGAAAKGRDKCPECGMPSFMSAGDGE